MRQHSIEARPGDLFEMFMIVCVDMGQSRPLVIGPCSFLPLEIKLAVYDRVLFRAD